MNTVTGTVLLNGKPAAGATIRFIAVNPTDANKRLLPMTVVKEDGTYRLATYEYGDGAPEGDYNVIIDWPTPDELTEPGTIPKDYKRLRREYGDRKKPKLHAEVKRGRNQLDFELQ